MASVHSIARDHEPAPFVYMVINHASDFRFELEFLRECMTAPLCQFPMSFCPWMP